jgi:RimJ/RimL family protein N-acetyltransferase
MVTELVFDDYCLVKPFFEGSEFDLLLSAILEGNSLAQVWVDDKSEPESVFLWDKANNVFYLAGGESNVQFNREIRALIGRKVVPELKLRRRFHFRLRSTSELWDKTLSSIFVDTNLTLGHHIFHTHQKPVKHDWRSSMPEGLRLKQIDEHFLHEEPYENKEFVLDEIQQMWPTVDGFVKFGFGSSIVTENQVVCWCTAEYMSKGKCGVGIETVHDYQNMGLATSAASAFVEHCKARNIKPHWECNAENLASRRVAEKVGFVKEHEYRVYHGKFK